MNTLNNYILEKLHIDKNIKLIQDLSIKRFNLLHKYMEELGYNSDYDYVIGIYRKDRFEIKFKYTSANNISRIGYLLSNKLLNDKVKSIFPDIHNKSISITFKEDKKEEN